MTEDTHQIAVVGEEVVGGGEIGVGDVGIKGEVLECSGHLGDLGDVWGSRPGGHVGAVDGRNVPDIGADRSEGSRVVGGGKCVVKHWRGWCEVEGVGKLVGGAVVDKAVLILGFNFGRGTAGEDWSGLVRWSQSGERLPLWRRRRSVRADNCAKRLHAGQDRGGGSGHEEELSVDFCSPMFNSSLGSLPVGRSERADHLRDPPVAVVQKLLAGVPPVARVEVGSGVVKSQHGVGESNFVLGLTRLLSDFKHEDGW